MPPQAKCLYLLSCDVPESFRGGERRALKEENHSPTGLRFWKASSQATTLAIGPSPSETAFCATGTPLASFRCSWKSSLVLPAQAEGRIQSCRRAREPDTSALEGSPNSGKNKSAIRVSLPIGDSYTGCPPHLQTTA